MLESAAQQDCCMMEWSIAPDIQQLDFRIVSANSGNCFFSSCPINAEPLAGDHEELHCSL